MAVIYSGSAHALPLLAESAALNVANNVVLHPDHEDPNKFYFFPASSELVRAKDGIPMFSFVYSGLSQPDPNHGEAHAMMSMVHRLTPSPQQVAAIDAFLKDRPQAGVAVLPIKSGEVELKSDTGKRALEHAFLEFNFPRYGPNSDGEIGINAVLNKWGAKILRASILGNGNSFLKTDYCFDYQGLGPVMDAKITAHMDRIYKHYRTSATVKRWLWFRTSVAREVEKLIDSRAITWEINGGDATDREYIRRIVDEITARIFNPELKPVPGSLRDGGSGSWFRLRHESTFKQELKTETWHIKDREIVTRSRCTPLTFDDVRPYRDKLVIDADREFFNKLLRPWEF